jgi:hypothetical protein
MHSKTNYLKKGQSSEASTNEEEATSKDGNAITTTSDFDDTFLSDPKVINAINSVQPYIRSNPRRSKRFLNIFRLLAMIANRRNLFWQDAVHLDHLAAWVIILMRWPDIIDILETDGENYISRLEKAQDLKRKMLNSEIQSDEKNTLDNLLADPKIQRMAGEMEFITLVLPLVEKLPNYIHLAKVK